MRMEGRGYQFSFMLARFCSFPYSLTKNELQSTREYLKPFYSGPKIIALLIFDIYLLLIQLLVHFFGISLPLASATVILPSRRIGIPLPVVSLVLLFAVVLILVIDIVIAAAMVLVVLNFTLAIPLIAAIVIWLFMGYPREVRHLSRSDSSVVPEGVEQPVYLTAIRITHRVSKSLFEGRAVIVASLVSPHRGHGAARSEVGVGIWEGED